MWGSAEFPVSLGSTSESSKSDDDEEGDSSTKAKPVQIKKEFVRIRPCIDTSSGEDTPQDINSNKLIDSKNAKKDRAGVTPKKKARLDIDKAIVAEDIANGDGRKEDKLTDKPTDTGMETFLDLGANCSFGNNGKEIDASPIKNISQNNILDTTKKKNSKNYSGSRLRSAGSSGNKNAEVQKSKVDSDSMSGIEGIIAGSCSEEIEDSSSERTESSTTSASIPEARNPLNNINIKEPSFNYLSEIPIGLPQGIPTGGPSTRRKNVEILILSATEFCVGIFTTHHQTHKRVYEYPTKIANKLSSLPQTCQRFENGKFIFKTSLATFEFVKDLITEGWKNFDFDGLQDVIRALVKYQHVDDDDVLDRTGHKYAELRINQFKNLRPYQRESILFAHLRQGRCMLADASGMGKRVEAIITCYLFEDEWPVIIICSTSQQQHWVTLLQKWLPKKERSYTVDSLESSEDCDDYMNYEKVPDFTVIGYTLLGNEANRLKSIQFKIAVIDESHKIKHAWTNTTKAARHIIKRAKRRLLLTSNPAFGVPDELFYQLNVIDRTAFKDHMKFASRFCGFEERLDARTGQVKESPSRNWRHAKNLDELKHLLQSTAMIRHFKSCDPDVHLPTKRRKVVKLDFQPDERTKRILGEMYFESKNSLDYLMTPSDEPHKRSSVFTWFKKSGKSKLRLICKYLDELDMRGHKIIIYARHVFVLNGIEELLKRKRIGYVRIMGDYETRTDMSDQFNENGHIKVALLSLNISEFGVNLTKADMVIFTELYWVPDSILRNEDRAWDFFEAGQENQTKVIEIIYLIACELDADVENQVHMDLHLWEMIEGKIDILMKLGLMEDNFHASATEEIFQPTAKDFDNDLRFSDISSNESDPDYVEEEESESESESEESSPCRTTDLSDENSSLENNGDGDRDISSPKIPSEDASLERVDGSTGSTPDSTDNNNKKISGEEVENSGSKIVEQPARRITRSQSQSEAVSNNHHESESEESDSDDQSSRSGDSLDDFVVAGTESEAEADNDSDDSAPKDNRRVKPVKRALRTRTPSKKTELETVNSIDESSEPESESTEDSEGYEDKVRKARRSFCGI